MAAHDVDSPATQAPVVQLVNRLVTDALAAGASDVHFEAQQDGLRVRYRIDGVLQDVPAPPASAREAIVSRLKVMAELDITERRQPHDGRTRLRVNNRELDVRVSTLPSLHGESVVLRLMETERQHLDLERLGMAEETLDALRRCAAQPHGVLLTTGPTGGGKTATLYALVRNLSSGREKIVSVEDPVEGELPGVVQVPVRDRGGVSFDRALRSILRHDPDVILVGELRDPETVEICMHAALTGHLVLSTLHTNDAPSALTRLLDFGVAPYLVGSTVEAVLAQRLARRVCSECAVSVATPEGARAEMERDGWTIQFVRVAVGCPACRGTGYRGRTGIFELLVVDEEIRDAVMHRQGAGPLRRLALEHGMRPLRSDGWRQVAAGVTTVEEVLRVLPAGLGRVAPAAAPPRRAEGRKARKRAAREAARGEERSAPRAPRQAFEPASPLAAEPFRRPD
jgi:type II secretory ATPase GspE/PulE/Tfp pilus assembly ATPase PilB-like protein